MSAEAVAVLRQEMVRKGQWLEWITVGWNVLECGIALAAGWWAGSIALVGFGFDSLIEVSSAVVLLWRLKHDHRAGVDGVALRAVGWCFLALAAYVGVDAARMLWRGEAPEESTVGIALAALSVVVMPLLARAKRHVAAGLNSAAMTADARQTDLCAYLSAILLVGLTANAWLGWWWMDPLAALAMVPIIAREGQQALRGQTCSGCGCH